MNHPAFTQLRRQIDQAITFHDLDHARCLAAEGITLAQGLQCPSEVLYFQAQQAITFERFTEAIDLLSQALVLNPSDGAAYNDIALCMVDTGHIEGVMEYFDQGIAVEPDYATIHHNKGWFLNKLGRPTEAIICFEQALAYEPQRVVTWENMGDAYEEQGYIQEALAAYRYALFFLGDRDREIGAQLWGEIKRLELMKLPTLF